MVEDVEDADDFLDVLDVLAGVNGSVHPAQALDETAMLVAALADARKAGEVHDKSDAERFSPVTA